LDQFNVGYCPARSSHELSNRIITPIYDQYGTLVAVSSRHFVQKKNFFHESFVKAFYLYGLHIAKHSIIKHKKAIVVEGEFDVMYLHGQDFPMSVGVCGSSFSAFQAAMLLRYCRDIYFVFDGDDKLNQTIARIHKLHKDHNLTAFDMRFFTVKLPNGFDPDDFVKKLGRKAFIKLLKETKQKVIN